VSLCVSSVSAPLWCLCVSLVSLRLSGVSAPLWCLCASLVSLGARDPGAKISRESARSASSAAIVGAMLVQNALTSSSRANRRARRIARASHAPRRTRRSQRSSSRAWRRARRYSRARRPARAPGHPCDLPLQISRAISFPRALTGFAGYYRPGCSCTPEGPGSFCETRAHCVFALPAPSPPVQLSWHYLVYGPRRESSQKVALRACSRIACVGCRAKQTSADNKDGSILRDSA
jgi:hypothetical protein